MTKDKRGHDFARLAHNILVVEKRYSLKVVASRMNIGYDTLHGRINNRVPFTAEEIRALLAAAPDPRFATFLLLGTPFVPADRMPDATGPSGQDSLRASVIRMLLEAGDAADAIERAIADGRIDHREAITIMDEISTAERAIATLREHVRQTAGKRSDGNGERLDLL